MIIIIIIINNNNSSFMIIPFRCFSNKNKLSSLSSFFFNYCFQFFLGSRRKHFVMIDNSVASAYGWTKTSVSCYKNADKVESRH